MHTQQSPSLLLGGPHFLLKKVYKKIFQSEKKVCKFSIFKLND